MSPSKKKPTQTDEGELFIGMVPKIQNYQKGKIYLYQEEKDAIEKAHRADIRRLGFSQLRDLLQSVFKDPDRIIGKKDRELFFQKRIDRSRSILVKVQKVGSGYKVAELMPIVHDRKLSSMNLNVHWKKEEPATEAVKGSEPTKEMIEFFEKRTAKHIERAVNNIDVIIKAFPDLDIKNLEKRKTSHDASKYEPEERLPYIWNTEFHRVNNKGGKFEYPPGMKELVDKATKHHITVNRHHPEAHKSPSDMSKEDLADMVADWAAMSQELGTVLRKWPDDNIGKRWKFSKDQIEFIYSIVDVFEKPAVEYVIKPEDTQTLWYENAKGKKWLPDLEKGEGMDPPKGYIYQVSKFPNNVRTNMLRSVVPAEVGKCKHPEEHIRKTYGWIDGMEGRECALCHGTQVKKVKDPWLDKWDAHGSRDFLTMSTSWTEEEVMALVNDAGYKLHEAILLATSMCGRCLSSLLYDNDSKEAEFAEFSLDWFNENVSCKHCEDHKMDPIDEDKLRRYRSNAPVYLGILESRFKKPEYKRSKKHWQAQYDLITKRLAEYEKKLGKIWKTDLTKSPIAAEKVSPVNFSDALGKSIGFLTNQIEGQGTIALEKVNGVDFNSALGKPISFLQDLIESVVAAEEIATEAWIDDLAGNKASLGKLPIDLKKSIEDTQFRPFGAWKGEAVKGKRNKLSPNQRLEVNKQSQEVLKKSRQDMTEDDLKTLQQYSGFGGTKSEEGEEIEIGILYDYYTSPPVALAGYKIIDNLFKIKPGMTACEPSCGNGVYMEVAPPGVKMTGIEYDARSSACADSLHDEAKVHNSSFEEFNLHSDEKFDLVIGNAPFGDRSGDTQYLDDPDEKNMDRYFLKASLKRLKPGGMLGLIVHSGVFENEKNKEWRKELLKLGKFQGAIRLPSESFQHTDTQVSPDMIFFKRHDESTQDRIDLAEEGELEGTGVYAADVWIEGSKGYYRAYPKHKLGEDEKGNFGQIYTKGKITAKKLDSAISSFKPYEYSINTYELGQRQIEESRRLDPGPRVKKLSESEAKAVANKDLRKGKIKIEEGAVYMLNDKYEWEHLINAEGELGEKIGRVLHLSQIIRQIRNKMQNDEPVDSLQKDGKELIQKFKTDFGNWHHNDKDIKRFFKQNSKIAGFEGVDIDIDHEILIDQNIYVKEIKYKDGHNIAIKMLLSYQDKNVLEVTTEQARDYAPTFGDTLIDECYNNKDIFIDQDLKWQLRENFIQGNAWDKVAALEATLNTGTHTPENIEKLEYSISELKLKAGWTSLEDIAPRPFDKWLPKEIVVAWLETHNMDRKVYYNEETGKWDAKDWQDKLDPDGAKYMRFLNRESQRGDTDTKRYNETKTEDFERFISTDQASREKIEEAYNKTYGGKIKGPNKTYSIDIDGWNDEIVLRPNQWQSIHHLSRKGFGTNGGFVGSGKTFAQIGLFGLLRQEGKVKRGFGQVPNNKVRDWVQDFNKCMPGLKVGYIDAKGEELDDADRNRRLQKLANGSYDIIILPESIATKLGLSSATNEIIDAKVVLLQTKDDKSVEKKTARAKVKSKEAAAKRVQAGDLTSNQTVTFDDFNVDFIFGDEVHNYKAIFKSKKSRGLGFKGGRESNRAMAMFKKMEAVRMKTGGLYTFGNTATPISNSPIELFNHLHLIGAGDELQRLGIVTIDDFIDEFCEVEETVMVDWATSQTKIGKKLVGFTRVDKLQDVFREYVDYQHDPNAVDFKKPTANYVATEVPVNEVQKGAVLNLREEYVEWKKEKSEASTAEELEAFRAKWGGQNHLTFFSKLRTASLDLELFDPENHKGWKNPKLEELAKKAWDNFERTGGGQVVFCDRVLSSKGDFSMHNKIREALVTVGFNNDEIVIVNGQIKGGLGKAKLAESKLESVVTKSVDGFNSGRYRVIIGTTNTLGEGVNLQRNSGGLWHFDIPYRPSDFIQRNGRIDRQGNEQKQVELGTFVSKGTIDSYSKGIVADKENWINQLLNTTSNVFANPDEGFDENSLELAMAEEFDTPEHVEQLKIEIAEKQKQAELDYNENQVKKVLPKFELISGAIWEFKGDKGDQIYQNMLRKREEYKKDLEKNPEFKNADLLQEEKPFYFEKETGTIYRQGDYFTSDKGIHQLTKVNPKKGTMVLTPIDETWKKTHKEYEYISRRGRVDYPDHKGYTIKGELPSSIKHMPDLKTPERLAQTETVFADDSAGFYEQPLDFQISNYKEFFYNRKKEEVPFYFEEKRGELQLNAFTSYGDEPKKISNPIHPEKAIKEFGKRLIDGTASIEIGSYQDDDRDKVIARVGQSTWNEWKKAEQQGEHPWLPEAYKHLDNWISHEELEKKLERNEDFKNDTSSYKIKNTFFALPDIESKSVGDKTFYIKKSQLKRGMEGDEYEIFEIASMNSQLSPESLKSAQAEFFRKLSKITWNIEDNEKYYKDDVEKILDENLSVKGDDKQKTATELMPLLREYYRKKSKALFDEENEIRKSQGMETLVAMSDEDIKKNLDEYTEGFRGEQMSRYEPQGEEAAKYFTLKDMVKMFDDYKLQKELTGIDSLEGKADNKKDVSRVTKEYIKEKKEEIKNEFETFLAEHKQKVKSAVDKIVTESPQTKFPIRELRDSLPFHTPISDGEFNNILLKMQEGDEINFDGAYVSSKDYKEPEPEPLAEPEKKPEPEPAREEPLPTERPEQETVKTADTDLNITDFTHTKTGELFRIVKMDGRVSKDRFYELKGKSKDFGGYYNRYAKGFMFKDPVKAREFANSFKV